MAQGRKRTIAQAQLAARPAGAHFNLRAFIGAVLRFPLLDRQVDSRLLIQFAVGDLAHFLSASQWHSVSNYAQPQGEAAAYARDGKAAARPRMRAIPWRPGIGAGVCAGWCATIAGGRPAWFFLVLLFGKGKRLE